MIFIIVYELTQPAENREALIRKIKAFGKWARISDSAYLVSSGTANPVPVRDALATVLNPNDRFYVGVSSPPSAWQGLPEDVAKWIVANQV